MLLLNFNEAIWNQKLLRYLCENTAYLSFRISLSDINCGQQNTSYLAQPFFEKMKSALVVTYLDTVYFNSEFEEINKILVYRINDKTKTYILQDIPGMSFGIFGYPEDPCFIKENGACFLKTVFHEGLCCIYDETTTEYKQIHSLGISIEREISMLSDIPRFEDKTQIEERIALKYSLLRTAEEQKEKIKNSILDLLTAQDFQYNKNYFYRIINEELFIIVFVDGEDGGNIYYDVLPLCMKVDPEMVIFPSFNVRVFAEETGKKMSFDLFAKYIFPELLQVTDIISLDSVRKKLAKWHGFTEEDIADISIYTNIKMKRYIEAIEIIEKMYSENIIDINEDYETGLLSESEWKETLEHIEIQFSDLLGLVHLMKNKDVKKLDVILCHNELNTCNLLMNNINEIIDSI